MTAAPLKPATNMAQQIATLQSRGMELDEAFASQWLKNVSYYRLSAYWYPARVVDNAGQRADVFVNGTSFADVASLYESDRKLRTLLHDGMERVEIAMRNRIGEALAARDPLAYRAVTNYRDGFDLTAWLKTAQSRIARSMKRNEAVKHYAAKYNGRYPFWVLAEVLDFADLSRLYEGLSTSMQQEIAAELNLKIDLASLGRTPRRAAIMNPPLARWLEQLSIVRNTCAHHARLWNKSFIPAQTNAFRTIAELKTLPQNQSERIFGVLVFMSFLLRQVAPGTSWPDKVATLINSAFLTNPIVRSESLGIPIDWDGTL